jgi:cytidylate kinase
MAVITISRQFGAGGRTLGKMVADKLGYAFYDNELIQMVAEKAKVSKAWVESMEKEAGGAFQRFITGLVSKSMVDRILSGERGYMDEEIYVDILHKVISNLAEEGNAVIIGRGGQYILQEKENVYHCLLVSDFDDRIRFMEKHYKMSYKQAHQTVTADDRRRANLYRKFGRQDYEKPGLYHVILNMSLFDLDKARSLLVKLVQG